MKQFDISPFLEVKPIDEVWDDDFALLEKENVKIDGVWKEFGIGVEKSNLEIIFEEEIDAVDIRYLPSDETVFRPAAEDTVREKNLVWFRRISPILSIPKIMFCRQNNVATIEEYVLDELTLLGNDSAEISQDEESYEQPIEDSGSEVDVYPVDLDINNDSVDSYRKVPISNGTVSCDCVEKEIQSEKYDEREDKEKLKEEIIELCKELHSQIEVSRMPNFENEGEEDAVKISNAIFMNALDDNRFKHTVMKHIPVGDRLNLVIDFIEGIAESTQINMHYEQISDIVETEGK